ncbi:MAG: hypothetical protein ACFFD4_36110 [Candidatus Odinarchaeota archaeon]
MKNWPAEEVDLINNISPERTPDSVLSNLKEFAIINVKNSNHFASEI